MSHASLPPQALAEATVARLLEHDAFSRWLGVEVLETAPRHSVVRMSVRPEMANGFGNCHGGVTYALADSALAFACNTHDSISVALDNAMAYAKAIRVGDVLTATCTVLSEARRVAFYSVAVARDGEPVAHFRATVYDTGRPLLEAPPA